MLSPDFLRSKFEAGLTYDSYTAGGTPDQQASWRRHFERAQLTQDQRSLLAGFSRHLNVLVTSGMWCGDCSAQVPMLAQIANATRHVALRILDRDEHLDLAEQIKICGGLRVPTVLFLNEDFEFIAIQGDKSLTRLRARAAKSLAACDLPYATTQADEAAATLEDWVRASEYAQLVVRLSPKLRTRHMD
jgi:hypothetical protein